MEARKGEPHMNTKTSLFLLNTTPALRVKKKTQQMNKSADLQSTYLQQFRWYPLPLIPLPQKTISQLCWLSQPLLPKYNLVPFLEEQVHQEGEEEVPQAEEEAHQEEEEVHLVEAEEEIQINLLWEMKNPWECYQWSLKEITPKLRVSLENSPPTSSLTIMSQPLHHS